MSVLVYSMCGMYVVYVCVMCVCLWYECMCMSIAHVACMQYVCICLWYVCLWYVYVHVCGMSVCGVCMYVHAYVHVYSNCGVYAASMCSAACLG